MYTVTLTGPASGSNAFSHRAAAAASRWLKHLDAAHSDWVLTDWLWWMRSDLRSGWTGWLPHRILIQGTSAALVSRLWLLQPLGECAILCIMHWSCVFNCVHNYSPGSSYDCLRWQGEMVHLSGPHQHAYLVFAFNKDGHFKAVC